MSFCNNSHTFTPAALLELTNLQRSQLQEWCRISDNRAYEDLSMRHL